MVDFILHGFKKEMNKTASIISSGRILTEASLKNISPRLLSRITLAQKSILRKGITSIRKGLS